MGPAGKRFIRVECAAKSHSPTLIASYGDNDYRAPDGTPGVDLLRHVRRTAAGLLIYRLSVHGARIGSLGQENWRPSTATTTAIGADGELIDPTSPDGPDIDHWQERLECLRCGFVVTARTTTLYPIVGRLLAAGVESVILSGLAARLPR